MSESSVRCIHVGDDEEAAEIHAHWAAGRDAEGWAMYWNAVYRTVLESTDRDEDLADRVLFVRYEELCARPSETIDRIVDHCRLPRAPFEPVRREYSARLSEPDYYAPDFSEREVERIRRITAETAHRVGYPSPDEAPGGDQ